MQKRLAADILDVGENRVWIDPDRISEVSTAITRADVKALIDDDAIKAKPKNNTSRGRTRDKEDQVKKGRRSGPGSRKGSKQASSDRKNQWVSKVRALRKKLRDLRDEGVIDSRTYRELYNKVKGGSFRSKAHLETFLEERGILEEG